MDVKPLKITECLNVIKNLFAEPKYEELQITMQAWIKLMCFVHLVGDKEITGLGKIENGVITDFKIPTQVVDNSTANATNEAMFELLKEIPVEEINNWELDWHSHATFDVFISTTDEKNYELMAKAKGHKQFPILVVNKEGDVCLKNFIHEGKVPDIKLTLLKEELSNDVMEGIYAECKKLVEERVLVEVPKPKTTNLKSWGSNYITKNLKKTKENIINADYKITKKEKNKFFCKECGCELITADEIDEGVCEDCNTWRYGYNQYYGW